MAQQISGLQGLAGINAIQEDADAAFATPEERSGGPANDFHGHVGETATPYSWESQAMPGGSHGPYGPQNQLLDDAFWFLEPAGIPADDPGFDYNAPSLTRSHGSVHNVGNSGPAPSQYEAVNRQVSQMGNKASDLGTSRSMTTNRLGDAKQDHWNEIWEINPGSTDLPQVGKQFSHQANGFGVNDAASNTSAKRNLFDYGSKHMHRRFAMSPIPGNHMWMRPQGRMLFKTVAGVARPPIGRGSQFEGQDVGATFQYDTGAVLQNVPAEYVPPPMPNISTDTAMFDDPNGTDPIALW